MCTTLTRGMFSAVLRTWVVTVVVVWASAGITVAETVNQAELRKIEETLRGWKGKIVTLHMEYESTWDKLDDQNRKVRMVRELVLTDTGKRRAHRVCFRDGKVSSRSLTIDDGRRVYGLRYDDGPSAVEKPDQIVIGPRGGKSSITEPPLDGLWFPSAARWLHELIADGKASVVGRKTVRGTPCVRLRVERAPKQFVEVLLDPAKDYLPVSVFTPPKSPMFQTEIKEFRRVDGTLWFPVSGAVSISAPSENYESKKSWRVTKLAINKPLANGLFRVPRPVGTPVIDTIRGTRSHHGSRTEIEKQRAAQAGELLSGAGSQQMSGAPQHFDWVFWSTVLAGTSAGCLFIACRIALQRKSQ